MKKRFIIVAVFLLSLNVKSFAQWQSPKLYQSNGLSPFIQIGGIPAYLGLGFEYQKAQTPYGIQFCFPFVFAQSKNKPSDFQMSSPEGKGILGSKKNPISDYAAAPSILITYQSILSRSIQVTVGYGLNLTVYNQAYYYPIDRFLFTSPGGSSYVRYYEIVRKQRYSPGITFTARVKLFDDFLSGANIFSQININKNWTYGTLGIQYIFSDLFK